MTDDKTTPDPKDIWRTYDEKERAFKALSASLHAANKKVVFDALEAAGITRVSVQFDGSGDSGQIEEIDAVSVSAVDCFVSRTCVEQIVSRTAGEDVRTASSVKGIVTGTTINGSANCSALPVVKIVAIS